MGISQPLRLKDVKEKSITLSLILARKFFLQCKADPHNKIQELRLEIKFAFFFFFILSFSAKYVFTITNN